MFRTTLATVLILAASAAVAHPQRWRPRPEPPTVVCEAPKRVAFLGVSSGRTTGDAGGIGGMAALCQLDYDAARVCDVSELIESAAPIMLEESAWVTWLSQGALTTRTCGLWTQSYGLAWTVGPRGPALESCDTALPVACCGWR